MSKVIEFPGNRKDSIEQAIKYFEDAYSKAGLSPAQINLAVNDLEPFIRGAFPRKEFIFNLPVSLNFNEEQAQAIAEEHNRCMQEAISYYGEQIWLSLCNLAAIIGRNVQENT